MGMLFNTKATTKMLAAVNDLFSGDNWGFWFTKLPDGTVPKDLFSLSSTTWPLWKIAKKVKLHGPDGDGMPKDKRWVKWLKGLDAAGAGTDLRNQIKQAFTDPNVSEIYFVLVPSDDLQVAPNPVVVGSTLVIIVLTVEIDRLPAFLTKQKARVAARRAARRNSGKKKKS